MTQRKHKPRLRHDERGITLVELLVAMMLLLLVLGTVVQVFITSIKAEPRISVRSHAIQEGRTLQEGLTRELRLAYAVQAATASSLTIDTFVHRASCGDAGSSTATAIQCRVTYSCASGSCTRSEGPVGGAAVDTNTLVTGISNSSAVFSYQPASPPAAAADITFVGVKLVFPGEEAGEDAITLEDGAALRNQ